MVVYTIKNFSNWISNYDDWASLKAFITSEAGGQLKVIESVDGKEAIIRYDKKSSNMNDETVRWARSIVWDCIKNRPLSVASPKAHENSDHIMPMTISDVSSSDFRFEDFYEGVTMNVYRSQGGQRIASRTRFGATGNFYSNRSFADLYQDACTTKGISPDLGPYDFMCIMIQHPEHRIVSRITAPNWIPLHAGRVLENGDVEITELTKSLVLEGTTTIKDWFAQHTIKHGWQWQGVVIKDGKGNRWRIQSSVYRMVRSLRGETPRVDERFFVLRSKGLIKTYLSYYPEDKQRYWEMESWLRLLTEQIFNIYCGVYKERSANFEEIPKMYQTHLSAIHSIYLGSLRSINKTVNMAVVRNYMNNLPVPRLLFMLNYNKRLPTNLPL
jgi:hypothetical protein